MGGGLLSVALSVGLPRLVVIQYLYHMKSGLSSPAKRENPLAAAIARYTSKLNSAGLSFNARFVNQYKANPLELEIKLGHSRLAGLGRRRHFCCAL